jgi:uncharacterized peroxidase-related enzyme
MTAMPADPRETAFLPEPAASEAVTRLYESDVADVGYVMNLSRVWAHAPEVNDHLGAALRAAAEAGGLGLRERGVLVSATAATRGDSYCALAWGDRLARAAGAGVAAVVLGGGEDGLDRRDRALARWARRVVADPNSATPADVQELRDAGFDDAAIAAITMFVALRLAFSTVNDALGAQPDRQLVERTPPEVRAAVSYGRPAAGWRRGESNP